MRVFAGLAAAVVVMAGLSVSAASARVVRMETAISLTDRSDPAVKQALLQDAVVLATIATDEDDHNEAPDNTRDQ